MWIKDFFTFSSKDELKYLKENYSNVFKFIEDYGYTPLESNYIKIDSFHHTGTTLDGMNLREEYDKVVTVLLNFKRPVDITSIADYFEDLTSQKLFVPSELVEYQYLTIIGWRYYDDFLKKGYISLSLVFTIDEWLPHFSNHEIKFNHDSNVYSGHLSLNITYETIENYYKQFLKEISKNLIRYIKFCKDNPNYRHYDWYIDKIKDKYIDKLPII